MALREATGSPDGGKELVLEAYEEHNVVGMVMREIEDVPVEDQTWARSSAS
jgi:hypothetical protein